MTNKAVTLSPTFKREATKAIFAICLFALTYLLIVILAVCLTAACLYMGTYIMAEIPSVFGLAFGLGLASLGVFVLIFLLKFIVQKHKKDLSHMVEIHEQDAPRLFAMLHTLATDAGTLFPQKVYLSADVNASVFYASSFWSMFLPIKKNLQIGLGLVNTVTDEELRGILAHEFGHFSQRSMKVGSYVYNVNQIIFNLLYENEGYKKGLSSWGQFSYFRLFTYLAVKINEGIQWILRQLYKLVNKSYLGLSREMEFHADAIAASITGAEPLKKALLRTGLADASYNNVLDYYERKIPDNIKSENIYLEQYSVMEFLGQLNDYTFVSGLPVIPMGEQAKYDKSKLVIQNQWASHPSIEDRLQHLDKLGFDSMPKVEALANGLLPDIGQLQKRLTEIVFRQVAYEGETQMLATSAFMEDYKDRILKDSFGKIFNSYYDHRNPDILCLEGLEEEATGAPAAFADLFSDEKVEWVYTAIALKNDILLLNDITEGKAVIKSFDYDGVRYGKKEAKALAARLETELAEMTVRLRKNDTGIYLYFLKLESIKGKDKAPRLLQIYQDLFAFDKAFDLKNQLYQDMLSELQFIHVTTPFEQITRNFEELRPREQMLKGELRDLIADPFVANELKDPLKSDLQKFVSGDWIYFEGKVYQDEPLKMLVDCLHGLSYLISRKYFRMKKGLLDYQQELQNGR